MKRSLGDTSLLLSNPVEDPLGCLETYNATLFYILKVPDEQQRLELLKSLKNMDGLLYQFLADQAAEAIVYGDIETTELIHKSTPIHEMEISVCTLLFVNQSSQKSDSFSLDFWGDDGYGQGAPLKFMWHALDHAKKLVFYNGIHFDLSVIANGDEQKKAMWVAKTHDPYRLLRVKFGSLVSLKLDGLLKCNNINPKTADGKAAVRMYKEREFEDLKEYNLHDVVALMELTTLPYIILPNNEKTKTNIISLAQSGLV